MELEKILIGVDVASFGNYFADKRISVNLYGEDVKDGLA